MADTKANGTDIIFKVGSTAVGGERGCNFQVNGSEIDVTAKDQAQWKEFLAGRSDWTAGGNGFLMFDASAHTLEAQQKALWTAISTGATVSVEIALTSTLKFSGTAIVTQFQVNADDDEGAGFTWAVRGAGALTLAEGGA